jgi:hypothetical protein
LDGCLDERRIVQGIYVRKFGKIPHGRLENSLYLSAGLHYVGVRLRAYLQLNDGFAVGPGYRADVPLAVNYSAKQGKRNWIAAGGRDYDVFELFDLVEFADQAKGYFVPCLGDVAGGVCNVVHGHHRAYLLERHPMVGQGHGVQNYLYLPISASYYLNLAYSANSAH